MDSEGGLELDDEGEEALWWKPAVPMVSHVRPFYGRPDPLATQLTQPTNQKQHTPQTRFAARIAYDGTRFNGWQYQVKSRTVQLEIERALNATLPVRLA